MSLLKLFPLYSLATSQGLARVRKRGHALNIFIVSMFLLLMAVVCVQPVLAQDSTATIVGVVTDPSGAPLSGASVTAHDVDRGTDMTAKTNDTGAFSIPRVLIGTYEVSVKAKGFETATYPRFTVVLNQTARLNFQMKIGPDTEHLEII